MTFSKLQLSLILGLYYIEKSKNVDGFVIKFNRYFHSDISSQTVLYELSKIKAIDPSLNRNGDTVLNSYKKIWDEYITSDNVLALKGLYRTFKNEMFINRQDSMASDNSLFLSPIESDSKVLDVKKVRQELVNTESGFVYPRSRDVVNNALNFAHHRCEGMCSNELFYRKDGKAFYVEAHHLIPLCYNNDFKYSLDVEANVVSLCPSCHRKLHYGYDFEKLLKQLYEHRIDRLSMCGLHISFEELLLLYR